MQVRQCDDDQRGLISCLAFSPDLSGVYAAGSYNGVCFPARFLPFLPVFLSRWHWDSGFWALALALFSTIWLSFVLLLLFFEWFSRIDLLLQRAQRRSSAYAAPPLPAYSRAISRVIPPSEATQAHVRTHGVGRQRHRPGTRHSVPRASTADTEFVVSPIGL